MLKRMKDPLLGIFLRLYAIDGGVEIWKALLDYNHECIDWDICEHGNALGQAVLKRDVDLVRFLLEEGADVKNCNFVGMPVLQAAKGMNAGSDIVDLLV